MHAYDPRIDAYIAKAADFAQPILNHLRELVHEVCPEVEETMKWSMPYFDYKGMMCGFASFKHHCSFGFWKASLLADPQGVLKLEDGEGMGAFGKLTSLKDLPSDKILKALIRDAMRLNDEGISVPAAGKRRGVKKEEIPEPEYLTKMLAENEEAKATWDGFPPSHRREYLQWLTEAKTEATREKRLATTMSQLAEGKHRLWKYDRKP